jgi:transposase-like protein
MKTCTTPNLSFAPAASGSNSCALTKNATLVCRRCGISAPTLRKWWRRYLAEGEAGLRGRSHRPHRSPGAKLTDEHIGWIIEMRSNATSVRAAYKQN